MNQRRVNPGQSAGTMESEPSRSVCRRQNKTRWGMWARLLESPKHHDMFLISIMAVTKKDPLIVFLFLCLPFLVNVGQQAFKLGQRQNTKAENTFRTLSVNTLKMRAGNAAIFQSTSLYLSLCTLDGAHQGTSFRNVHAVLGCCDIITDHSFKQSVFATVRLTAIKKGNTLKCRNEMILITFVLSHKNNATCTCQKLKNRDFHWRRTLNNYCQALDYF